MIYLASLLTNVLITTFLTTFASVVTIIAASSIQGALALSDSLTIWLTTLNLLGLNLTVPIASWFATRFGYKKMYIIGIFIFVSSSLLGGCSLNFLMIATARFIEGIGTGLIFPVGLSLIAQNFPPKQLPLALILYVAAIFGGGFAIGLPLAGYLTQWISWRAPFFLIAATGFLGIFACTHIQEKKELIQKQKLDFFGFLFFSLFISLLLIALTLGPLPSTNNGWRSPFIIACFISSFISLLLTLYIDKKHENPIIPLSLFKDPIFSLSCLAMFLLGMSIFGSAGTIMNYMLNALFYEKYIAGKIGITFGVSLLTFSILANFLMRKIPIGWLTFSGFCLIVYSYFLNNILDWQSGPSQIFPVLFLRGAGLGLALGPATTQALLHVPHELAGKGATLLTFFRQVGSTYGGTLITIIVIKRKIFHAARFGEQTHTELPGYQVTFQKLFSHYSSTFADQGKQGALLAKERITQNIEIQAFIQAMNDAMIVFGYITTIVALALAVYNVQYWWKKKKQKYDLENSC